MAMTQTNWDTLRKFFDDPNNFDKDGYAYDSNVGFNLMEWLDCSSTCPSWDMRMAFADNGYHVYSGESDSFGWLIGIVEDRKTHRMITFG